MITSKIHIFERLLHDAMTYLPAKTYEHSLRVMLYVMCNNNIPQDIHDDCIIAAIAHDLIEDAGFEPKDFPTLDDDLWDALQALTKRDNEDYVEYIKNIKGARGMRFGQIAYWVKMADMKDHLTQKDTLTDHLKKKYLEALPYLLP